MTDMKRESGAVARMWKWLTEPSPRLTDPGLRQRSRLLSSLLLLTSKKYAKTNGPASPVSFMTAWHRH